MIQSKWAVAAVLVLTSAVAHAQKPAVGAKAPEIGAKEWLNNVGPAPSLENLRGQPVLLEFWATW